MSAAVEASEKLSEEELALEDVKTALALMDEAVKALSDAATADEPPAVAKIGETEYATLDEAVAAAADGAVIELLADCETAGLNLSKNLTIKGNHTVTFTEHGIALWGKSLTFDGCTVVMNGIGSTPYTEWNWVTICASKNASLTLNNATMTMDGQGLNKHAVYFCSNNKLNLYNSSLTISNYGQDALEWDDKDSKYDVNIVNSTFTSDHNRSGITGTFNVTIDSSTVKVVNSTGNGSNGSHFIIKNGSKVDFSGNGSHGLSTGLLSVENSTITANNNGMCGVIFTGAGTFVNSDITITGTKGTSYWNAGMRLSTANATASIDGNTRLTITDNYVTGLFLDSSSQLSIAEGAQVLITRNRAEQANCSTAKDFALCGGGIAVRSGASAVLSSTTQIYNNHAALAGDDIYVEEGGSISFGAVGSGWTLDDCSHAIDGWYDDSANVTEGDSTTYNRWNAHDSAKKHIVLSAPGSYTRVTALKAAHGTMPPAEPLPWPDSPENISRSKTATNLDTNFESTVTLGLPAAEQQLVSDVVFVLDKSTSADVENQVLDMLRQLNEQIRGSSAAVKVGVVIFNKQANIELKLTELNDQSLSAIQTAIQTEISSGTNTHAGLLAGKAMLDADSSVDAGRKYLIFVSDGISYIFDAEANSINSQQMTTGEYAIMAGPDCWGIRHYQEGGQKYIPEDFGSYLGTVGRDLSMVQQYIQSYASTSSNQALHIPRENGTAYPSCVDVALYKTALAYQSAVGSGYNCYAVTADTGSGGANPWGPDFMSYLAQGKTVNFDSIKNDILYLLSAGSTVEDYIGSGKDNKGKDYNMDFVNDISRLSLTVGGVELDKVKIENNRYGFGAKDGSYRFVLEYFPDSTEDANDEHFVWHINESIKITDPVQLSYVVKLSNPQTTEGTYGEYDANGSQGKTALYTNNSATLYPVDSNNNKGAPQIFPKPTVSYEVKGEPLPWPDSPENISRSKTATNLDTNFESTVTLGLPAAEQQLVSDVVFVLDKSTSADVENQVLDMLSQLNEQIRGSSAAVKVGVVIFNKQANNVLELTELNDANLSTIESAIQTKISSGTNTHAGLLAGRAMLDADSSVDAGRKYLIFVSDGISYMYNAQPTVTAWSFKADSWANWAGPDNWSSKYGSNAAPANWGTWLADIKAKVEAQGTTYEYPYGGTATKSTPQDEDTWNSAYATSVDKALYMSYQTYTSAISAGYNCYAVDATSDDDGNNLWGHSFMNYLAQDQTVSFEGIKNDILYLLSAGSTVVDEIGSGTDDKGNAYNMDFVNDISRLKLTVDGEELDKVQISENKYGFGAEDGSYRFVLEYFPESTEDANDEHFVWHINESIKITDPVQLSYVVKLSNPQTTEGTYGEYDANGSQGKTALYTNNSATLYPVDSNNNKGAPQIFPKPTVSYTVAPALISIDVTKVWKDNNDSDGLRPDSLKVSLYANDVDTGMFIVLSEGNKWQGSFDSLPAAENGKIIDYKVYEETVSGYTAQAGISETDDGFAVTLTNTHTVETVSIPVQKIWQDNNNLNGRRPHSVTIYLYANGDYTGETLVLRSRDNWAGSFDNLPKYINGQLIEYTVREKSMYYYNGKVSANPNGGFTVTNYYTTTPGTGDSSNIWIWLIVCACSLAAGTAAFETLRRRKNRN